MPEQIWVRKSILSHHQFTGVNAPLTNAVIEWFRLTTAHSAHPCHRQRQHHCPTPCYTASQTARWLVPAVAASRQDGAGEPTPGRRGTSGCDCRFAEGVQSSRWSYQLTPTITGEQSRLTNYFCTACNRKVVMRAGVLWQFCAASKSYLCKGRVKYWSGCSGMSCRIFWSLYPNGSCFCISQILWTRSSSRR